LKSSSSAAHAEDSAESADSADSAGTGMAALFSADGVLSRRIEGYRARTQQVEMAEQVAAAVRANGVLVCEAGTGTGKTFAYLVPALLSGGKVIISTGTKTLQDQLYHRDLPTARAALGVPVSTALLKGRANYLCHYHLERNLRDGRLASREDALHLQTIARFAKRTQSGDCSELAEVPENSGAWSLATSTRENCLGQQCPDHDRCFVMAARRAALAADVVVVNHHLFLADLVLKGEGMAELLPACNTVIFDEAHQLPQAATLFFGETLSTGQLLDLARDARVAVSAAAGDTPGLPPLIGTLERAARELRLALPRQPQRFPGALHGGDAAFIAALDVLDAALTCLEEGLESVAERDESLGRAAARAAEARARLGRWRSGEDQSRVRWIETFTQSLALHSSPLSVAGVFREQIDARPRSWIFTSATLAVDGDFAHYRDALGLHDARTGCWGSPFDYASRARLYVPRGLPDPGGPEHTRAVVAAALPLIRAAGGSAFLLFTTLRAMRLAHEVLGEVFKDDGDAFPLLVQGEAPRRELLERFRRLGNAVLVASASFWEGVDVRGEALRLVVIDKLPFAPPDDPVMEERLKAIAREGRNAFMEYQLPQAVIALKQGAGRLIRDETDHGVLMVADPRLVAKSYGRAMIASLPPMTLVRDGAAACAFLSARGEAS
jgi:ATP-dependent DNA helicase DinG